MRQLDAIGPQRVADIPQLGTLIAERLHAGDCNLRGDTLSR
jgi:hypothetical protein